MRSLSRLLLSSVALGPTSATPEALRAAVREAAGPSGLLDEVTHDGDPREPATLHALFASPGSPSRRATLLFLHGKGGCGAEWRRDAARALGLGYNVLVPELRGHPPSTGERITYGLLEREDLGRLLEEAARRLGLDPLRLGVDACSMGTLVALQLAAAGPSPAALWLQSPFSDLSAMAVHYVGRATGLPDCALSLPVRLAVKSTEWQTGLSLSALDPVAAAARVRCPTMVVHGEEDQMVPIRHVPPIVEALAGEKELWRVPRGGHCHHPDEPQALRRAEYARRWSAFFSRTVPPELR